MQVIIVMFLVLILTPIAPVIAADEFKFESMDLSRIKANQDGTYRLDDKNIGAPNNSFFWDKWMDSRHVVVWGPEHRSLCEYAAVRLKDGRLLVVSGGESVHSPYAVSNFVDLTKWTDQKGNSKSQPIIQPGPKPNFARLGAACALLDNGRVLIAGGAGRFPEYNSVEKAEIFDPKTNKFSLIDSSMVPRRNCVTANLRDGRVLIMGGLVGRDNKGVSDVELFDPKTSRFTKVGNMNVPRYRHAAVTLDDGRVMIIGGCPLKLSKIEDTATLIEYFNPETNEFEAGSELTGAPNGPTAIKLDNGDVVMFGGTVWQKLKADGCSHIQEIEGFFSTGKAFIIHPDPKK